MACNNLKKFKKAVLDDDRSPSAVAEYLKNLAVRANKRFQHVTIFEHARCICCAGSVEVGQIQLGQTAAVVKHIGHVRHIGGIKVTPKIDFFQVDKPPKHIGGIRIRSNLPIGGYIQIVAAHPSKNASVSRV